MGEQHSLANPITVFYSYAPADERLRKQLETHLSLLRQQGTISTWHHRQIVPGTDWQQVINEHLLTASVILLLISPDFLDSDYYYSVEMKCALTRQKAGEASVIPILLRPIDKESAPFAYLQCLPRNGKPVTTWSNRDEAFREIARGIRQVIEELYLAADSPNYQSALPPSQNPVPLFMATDLPGDFVMRPQEFEPLKNSILYGERDRPTAITAALRGAGGYGKTALAQALCHDTEIQAAFPDGILWVTLGEKPQNLIGKIEDLLYLLSRERPGFTSLEAATTRLKSILAKCRLLLVIDDVWHTSDLMPFLQGGPQCARLITTRIDQILPSTATYNGPRNLDTERG